MPEKTAVRHTFGRSFLVAAEGCAAFSLRSLRLWGEWTLLTEVLEIIETIVNDRLFHV
jgi:hypothetical protein